MKNLLAIEIKDNKIIVTLTKYINGKHNLMYHKSYEFIPLQDRIAFNASLIPRIKNDLIELGLFETINKSTLTINTSRVVVKTFKEEFKYDTDLELEKEKFKNKLKNKWPDSEILKLEFPYKKSGFTKKIINSTVESVERSYLKEVVSMFRFNGINISKVVPMLDVIEESMKENSIDKGITFSVLVEEKFTQLTTFENGSISFSTKWKSGLNDIYKHISKIMNININESKKLFKFFGSIPPEDVVDDKVIHTIKHGKEVEVFTKKDLSKYITEKVNELFSNVKSEFPFIADDSEERKIIFSGEIKSLNGFKKYAKKSFAEKNVEKFSSKLIGLSEEAEFVTLGILNIIQDEKIKKSVEGKLDKPKISAINKFIRMYNYI